MYSLKSDRRRGNLELCAMQEYGILYGRKKVAERMINETEAEEKTLTAVGNDIRKYLDTLNVGLQQWFAIYINLTGKENLTQTTFENMLKRKNYI